MTNLLVFGTVFTILLVIGMYILEVSGRLKSPVFDLILLALGIIWSGVGFLIPDLSLRLGGVGLLIEIQWLGSLLLLVAVGRWLYKRMRTTSQA